MSNVYIVDNGEAYSSHTLYFIETDWNREQLDAFLKQAGFSNYFITGAADKIEWWEGGSITPEDLLEPYTLLTEKEHLLEPVAYALGKEICLKVLAKTEDITRGPKWKTWLKQAIEKGFKNV